MKEPKLETNDLTKLQKLRKKILKRGSSYANTAKVGQCVEYTDNSLPVLLSSWNYGDKYAKECIKRE